MNWFDSQLGKNLVSFEQKTIEKYLDQKFGYYALQLGEHKSNLIKNTKIKHQIVVSGKDKNVDLDAEWLPFSFDSIDLTLCLHVFERAGDPKKIMDEFEIGVMVENHNSKYLADTINEMLNNREKRVMWKQNMQKAKKELNWEKEEKKLIKIFAKFL